MIVVMEWFKELVRAFLSDPRTLSLLALILLDIAIGVMAALRTGTFEWGKLGQFYKTMVVPYVIGYLVAWVLTFYGLAQFLPVEWLIQLVGTGLILPLVASLLASIVANLRKLGFSPPEP